MSSGNGAQLLCSRTFALSPSSAFSLSSDHESHLIGLKCSFVEMADLRTRSVRGDDAKDVGELLDLFHESFPQWTTYEAFLRESLIPNHPNHPNMYPFT